MNFGTQRFTEDTPKTTERFERNEVFLFFSVYLRAFSVLSV